MPKQQGRVATSTIHKHLTQLQHKAMSLMCNTIGTKGVDNPPIVVYTGGGMSTNLAAQIKCKHCDKTFPTPEAHKAHLKKVEAGLRGGYRKHRAPIQRYEVRNIETKPHTNGNTALDKLAAIRARKTQLLDALSQTQLDEEAAMQDVQREYDEQSKKLAALSTELTVQRRTQIALREEMEAHKPTPVEGT